jgi:hypothetical protein
LESEKDLVDVHTTEIREFIDKVAAVMKEEEPTDSDIEDEVENVAVAHDDDVEQERAELQQLVVDKDFCSYAPILPKPSLKPKRPHPVCTSYHEFASPGRYLFLTMPCSPYTTSARAGRYCDEHEYTTCELRAYARLKSTTCTGCACFDVYGS